MNVRTHLIQTATLIAAAVVLAVVSNALASRERQMKLAGSYPNATKVSLPLGETAPPPATTTTVAPAPVATVTTTTQPIAPAPATVAPPPATTTTTTTTTTTATAAATKPAQAPKAAAAPPATAPVVTAADVFARFQPHEKQPYIELTYNDVRSLYDAGALFLDARRTSVYEQGHIAGARPFSVWEADADDKVAKLFNERGDPREQALPIVVYCSGGDCEDSHMLSQKLWGAQFNNVYVYKDGFPDWQKHGAPVHEGTQP